MRFEWTGTAFYEGSITLSSNKLVSSTCLLTGFFDEKTKMNSAKISHANLFPKCNDHDWVLSRSWLSLFDTDNLSSQYLVLKQILSND